MQQLREEGQRGYLAEGKIFTARNSRSRSYFQRYGASNISNDEANYNNNGRDSQQGQWDAHATADLASSSDQHSMQLKRHVETLADRVSEKTRHSTGGALTTTIRRCSNNQHLTRQGGEGLLLSAQPSAEVATTNTL